MTKEFQGKRFRLRFSNRWAGAPTSDYLIPAGEEGTIRINEKSPAGYIELDFDNIKPVRDFRFWTKDLSFIEILN